MRSRALPALGALAATGALALSLTGAAHAADGVVFTNGFPHENPSGCISPPRAMTEGTLENQTNAPVLVYSEPDCSGAVVELVPPGATNQAFAVSFSVE